MRKLASIVAAGLLFPTFAFAETYLSNGGSDSNDCLTVATACSTFPRAYAASSTNLIVILNAGTYGTLSVDRSMSIVSNGGQVPVYNARIEVNVGSEDEVYLSGLNFVDSPGSRLHAIQFLGGRALRLNNMQFSNYKTTTGSPSAIKFFPSGASHLVMTDTVLSNNGFQNAGAGLQVKPTGSGSARVTLSNVRAENNVFGVALDGSTSTGGINATVIDSVLSSNRQDGFVATSSTSTAPIGVTFLNSKSTNNTYGVRSIGANVTVRLKDSALTGNVTGLSGGGTILTGGNNVVEANADNGSFTGSFTQK